MTKTNSSFPIKNNPLPKSSAGTMRPNHERLPAIAAKLGIAA